MFSTGTSLAFIEFQDRFATDFIDPTVDKQQDWTLNGYKSGDLSVTFRITRKLVTCDDKDLPIHVMFSKYYSEV